MNYIVTTRDTESGKTTESSHGDELAAVRLWSATELYANTEPVSITTPELRACEIELKPGEVTVVNGGFVVDGMSLADWAEAMTMD
jgi:hypothetical protein